MPGTFKVLVHHRAGNLHLKLYGDFDGSSAHQLCNLLRRHCPDAGTVFVHTGSLNRVEPFGCDVFQQSIKDLDLTSTEVVFTGEKAAEIAPRLLEHSVA